jgi:hypothetical protein
VREEVTRQCGALNCPPKGGADQSNAPTEQSRLQSFARSLPWLAFGDDEGSTKQVLAMPLAADQPHRWNTIASHYRASARRNFLRDVASPFYTFSKLKVAS